MLEKRNKSKENTTKKQQKDQWVLTFTEIPLNDLSKFKSLVETCISGENPLKELEEYYENHKEGDLTELLPMLLTKKSKEAYNLLAIAAPYQTTNQLWYLKILLYGCLSKVIPLKRIETYYEIVQSGDIDDIFFSLDDPFCMSHQVKNLSMTMGAYLDKLVDNGDEVALHCMYYAKKYRTKGNRHPSPRERWLDEEASDDEIGDLIIECMKCDVRCDELKHVVQSFTNKGKLLDVKTISYGKQDMTLADFIVNLDETINKPISYPFKDKVLELI